MKGNMTSTAAEPAGAPLESQTNPPHHILVAEDETFLRRLNTEVLLGSGYEVDTATDGAAAWQALNTNSYDLLITGNNMPLLSGVELLQKLRAARMALPVIMATDTLPTEQFTRFPWLQPTATLLRPYTFQEMLKTVKAVLRETDIPITNKAVKHNQRQEPHQKRRGAGTPRGGNTPRSTP